MHRTLLLLVLLALPAGCDGSGAADPVPGVRLGMTPRDVRDRWDPEGKGTWQTKLGAANDDTVLEWASTGGGPGTQARFEFHLGMLVAVRAHLREATKAERIDRTAKTVTVRRPEEGGTEVTLLSRDCPTHHDEAESLAARAR
ncbi:MAG: hypothetical protein JWP97_1810 [Labilithrix sp.]|nr:hypothetical protein [Labilithrix sp.]